MPISTLLTIPCTIVRLVPSSDEDEYGNEQPGEDLVETVCELQQQQRNEPADQGELSDTRWLGVFLPGFVLRTGDSLETELRGDFEVVGDSWPVRNPRTQAEHHVEATLRQTRGAEEAS